MTREKYTTKAAAWRVAHGDEDPHSLALSHRFEATKIYDHGSLLGLNNVEVAEALGLNEALLFIWRASRMDCWAEMG